MACVFTPCCSRIVISFPYLGEALGLVGPTAQQIAHVHDAFNVDEYISALIAELYYRSEEQVWQRREVRSIEFVGGSSWLVCPENFGKITTVLRGFFTLARFAAVVVESDPVHINKGTVEQLLRGGMNALLLRAIPRRHENCPTAWDPVNVKQSLSLLEKVRTAGCDDVGLELVFGQSGLDTGVLLRSLRAYISQWPARFRCRFGVRDLSHGVDAALFEEAALQRRLIRQELESFGYIEDATGEFSTVATTDAQATQVLGIGAGLSSYYETFSGHRIQRQNVESSREYARAVQHYGHAVRSLSELSKRELFHKALAHDLHSRSGVNIQEIKARFGILIEERLLRLLEKAGYLTFAGEAINLSDKGVLVSYNLVESIVDDCFDSTAEGVRSVDTTFKECAAMV